MKARYAVLQSWSLRRCSVLEITIRADVHNTVCCVVVVHLIMKQTVSHVRVYIVCDTCLPLSLAASLSTTPSFIQRLLNG